jgi:hypothetical protein
VVVPPEAGRSGGAKRNAESSVNPNELSEWVWSQVIDAYNSCILAGWPEASVYELTVEEFGDLYQSVQRIQARNRRETLILMQNAFNGNKKTLKDFMKTIDQWLPSFEKGKAKGNADGLTSMLRGIKNKH